MITGIGLYLTPPFWRRLFGAGHWRSVVLAMNYFGAGVYLLDYYYAHVVVSRNVCFPYCSEVFQEGNCFLKKAKSVVRLS